MEYLRAQDPTRMYAQGSNDFIQQCLSVNDDFWSTMKTDTPWEYKMARRVLRAFRPAAGPGAGQQAEKQPERPQ